MSGAAGKEPIRVFVGTSADQRVAFEVLAHSARLHASRPVELVSLDGRQLPVPRDPRNRARTGFSFARFEIPRLCGRQGRALYLDADMLVLGDLAELWSLDLAGADLLHSAQPPSGQDARFSVLLLDCARLDWSAEDVVRGLDAGDYTYEEALHAFCLVPEQRRRAAIPERWNALDRWDPDVSLVHYTSVPTQPWVHGRHPAGAVWYRHLRSALDAGVVTPALLADEARRGHVSPHLLAWARTAEGGAR